MFKFIAGIVSTVPMEHLNAMLFNIMSPLVREITIEETNVELRRLGKEVATMIKRSIGSEEYAKLLSRVQQKLDIKKAEKKRIRAQQVKSSICLSVSIDFYVIHCIIGHVRLYVWKLNVYACAYIYIFFFV